MPSRVPRFDHAGCIRPGNANPVDAVMAHCPAVALALVSPQLPYCPGSVQVFKPVGHEDCSLGQVAALPGR